MTRLFSPEAECVVRIHAQLEHLVNIEAGTPFANSGPQPTREQLSTLIETAFWASLQPNEGRTTRVSLAVAAPERHHGATIFASPVACEESAIVKLAPAVPIGHCLGVTVANDRLQIWGFAHKVVVRTLDTVAVEIAEPGTVRVDVGPFRPYAVLNRGSDDILESTGTDLPHYLQRKLRKGWPENDFLETQAVWRESLALADLVRMILGDGHGGAVLLVSSETGEWQNSLNPFPYRLKDPDTTVRDVIRKELDDRSRQGKALQELSQARLPDDLKNRIMETLSWNGGGNIRAVIGPIASMAKVDGAVVMTRDIRLLGFGAKIDVRQGPDVPVCKLKPTPGVQEVIASRLEDLGGMRHQSAARFIEAN